MWKNVNISNFQMESIKEIKEIIKLIECSDEQKEIILLKAEEILNQHISRAEKGEIQIRNTANIKKIASAIIWTVIISTENMPKITVTGISRLISINIRPNDVSNYYKKYFKHLYPRNDFRFSSYQGFKDIRNILAIKFLELMKKGIKTAEYATYLKKNILMRNRPSELIPKNIDILYEMVTKYEDIFAVYFSNLAEIVKQLVVSSEIHKKIGAQILIKNITKFLMEKGISLCSTSFDSFNKSVLEIYDILKGRFPLVFPNKSYSQIRQENYEIIVGTKLKIYVIKNIYNRKYFRDELIRCPECEKEGLLINTNISRIINLQFHHSSEEKENMYTIKGLYDIFIKNQHKSSFLDDIIRSMERDGVELLCRNHHIMLHNKYFNYFKDLINWENIPDIYPQNIFLFSPELIHILINVSINNFCKTKCMSKAQKKNIKLQIISYLKKRYIIMKSCGNCCSTCGEFDIIEHLPAFHFIHFNKKSKSINASRLYRKSSCYDIAQILEYEQGMYVCSNCHTIFDYNSISFLNEIYEDRSLINEIYKDYNNVSRKIRSFKNPFEISFKDPFEKSGGITNKILKYLDAVNEISQSGRLSVNRYNLARHMGCDPSSVWNFFERNDIITTYIDTIRGGSNNPNEYILTREGRDTISLIYHIRDYYRQLELI
jgi:hypothetical protein